MRDAYGVIMHQAAPSSCLRTEKVDIRFVLFSKKNIFSRLIGHLGKIQIGKSKLVSLTSTQITLLGPIYKVFKIDMREIKRLLGHQKCTLKS